MSYAVTVAPILVSPHEGAVITIADRNTKLSALYFDFTALLKSVRNPTERSLDFLLVAATVYALDKLVARSQSHDGWTRTFEVSIPVADPRKWKEAAGLANKCLSFLSGDEWRLSFTKLASPIIRRRRRKRRSSIPPRYACGDAACLFSGGLDSLIGAINWLERNPNERIALVGHHDPGIGGPLSDQRKLLSALEAAYPSRITSTFVGIGHQGKSAEITMRSRSILFVALGLVVADCLGLGTPLLIPENGTIALNVPLTPARRGSCSTRTAHPSYLAYLRDWMSAIGIDHPISNPLVEMTKGEAVAHCDNLDLLSAIYQHSVSCAKSGHKSTWINRTANGCGRCMPCIYRRAALHTARLDSEVYGVDFCRGRSNGRIQGLRRQTTSACLSFLLREPSEIEIAKMLVANGLPLPFEAIRHSGTVIRAMDEIRSLIADKGTSEMKRAAGLARKRKSAN
ncbi:MAG: Qat anti-phage system QueC-like protein QatC [Pirellulales bacterium]